MRTNSEGDNSLFELLLGGFDVNRLSSDPVGRNAASVKLESFQERTDTFVASTRLLIGWKNSRTVEGLYNFSSLEANTMTCTLI